MGPTSLAPRKCDSDDVDMSRRIVEPDNEFGGGAGPAVEVRNGWSQLTVPTNRNRLQLPYGATLGGNAGQAWAWSSLRLVAVWW